MDTLLIFVLSFIAAFVPTCFFVALAYLLDRYEKEPFWILAGTFLWGALPAIILSLVTEVVLDIPIQVLATGQGADLLSAAFVAPVVEEVAKAIPLVAIFLVRRKEFDGIMDGLIYGAVVGFGFSMTENVFYFVSAFDGGGWVDWGVLVVMRGLVFGLNHALFTSALGAALGYARYATRPLTRRIAPLVGLFGAIALHMIHNFFVSLPDASLLCLVSLGADWLGVIVWLILMLVATRKEQQWITEELQEEVNDGLLTPEQARASARYRTRLRDRFATMRAHGVGRAYHLTRLHNAAAELAFKKRQLRLHGDEGGNLVELMRLRALVRDLREKVG